MIKDVFLSSTFNDFQKERDLFRNRIATEISDKLNDSIISFVDLRWGIDTSNTDAAMQKVLRICSDVINQTKPMFILMLGDCYGSLPSKEDYKLIAKLNNVDTNEIKSVTEFETIVSGIYNNHEEGFYLVLNRNIINKSDFSNSSFLEKNYKDKLDTFKNKIFNTNSIFIDYEARFVNENEVEIIDEDCFVNKVVESIFSYLIKDLSYNASNTRGLLYQVEHDFFVSLENDRLSSFYGREKELNEICELIDNKKIVYIDGKSGIGKTSLMVKLKDRFYSKGICTSYYCGDTFTKPSYAIILNYLANYFQTETNDIYVLLKRLPQENMHYIFIDAINECSDNLFESLNQNLILDNVRIIMSGVGLSKPDYILDEFSSGEVLSIINVKCNHRYKEVPTQFLKYIENNENMLKLLCYPIQLSFFTNSMMNLNEKDFAYIKGEVYNHKKDFIDVLSMVFIKKLETLNVNFDKNIDNALNVKCDTNLKIILLISKICLRGVSIEQLSNYYEVVTSKEFSIYDFYNMRYSLGDLYQKDFTGKYHITHALLRNYIDSKFTYDEIKNYSDKMVDYILKKENISINDYAEVLYQLYQFNNIEKLSNVMNDLFLNGILTEQEKKNICEISLVNEKYEVFKAIVDRKNANSIAFCLNNLLGYIDNTSLIINQKIFFDAYKVLREYKNGDKLKEWYQDITLLLYNFFTSMTNQKAMLEIFIDDQYVAEALPVNNFIMIANNPFLKVDDGNRENLYLNIKDSIERNLYKESYSKQELNDFLGEIILSFKALNSYPFELRALYKPDLINTILQSTIKLLNNEQVFINNKITLASQYCYFMTMLEEYKNEQIFKYLASIVDKYEAISVKEIDVYYTLMIAYYFLGVHYSNDICFNNFLHFIKLYVEMKDEMTSIIELNLVSQILPDLLNVFSQHNFKYDILRDIFKKFIYKYNYIGDFSVSKDTIIFFLQSLYLTLISCDNINEYDEMINKINENIMIYKTDELVDALKWIENVTIGIGFVDSNKAELMTKIIVDRINKFSNIK